MLIGSGSTDIGTIASVVSIALAAFAIWQASTFYRWSNQASIDAKRSADAVGESVRKLEELFNRLYSDTFGMMRETVTDMRKHIWPSHTSSEALVSSTAVREVEERSNEKVAAVREELMGELRLLVERLGATTAQVGGLEGSLNKVLDRAITGSREAETDAIRSTVRDRLLASLARLQRRGQLEIPADTLLSPVFSEFEPEHVHEALVGLREEGFVDWDGGAGWVEGPDVPLKVRRSPPIQVGPGHLEK